jgi:hypothetical protein
MPNILPTFALIASVVAAAAGAFGIAFGGIPDAPALCIGAALVGIISGARINYSHYRAYGGGMDF